MGRRYRVSEQAKLAYPLAEHRAQSLCSDDPFAISTGWGSVNLLYPLENSVLSPVMCQDAPESTIQEFLLRVTADLAVHALSLAGSVAFAAELPSGNLALPSGVSRYLGRSFRLWLVEWQW